MLLLLLLLAALLDSRSSSTPGGTLMETRTASDEIDVQTFIQPEEVPVSWDQFDRLTQRLALQLMKRISQHGPFDFIVVIKHGATTSAALLERVLDHLQIGYARFKRLETGLSEADSPPPRIVYFPSSENFHDKRVLVLDEVWETGKTIIRAEHEIESADPKSITLAVLHFKPQRNIYPTRKPDCFAEEIDPRYRLYPWELFERVVMAQWERMQETPATT